MPFAVALTVILAVLAMFQLALVAGAPWGRLAWGGAHAVLPKAKRIGSLLAVVIYAVIVVVAFSRLGALPLMPTQVAVVAMWIVFAYFVLGVVMNALSRSTSERRVMVPVTVVLAVLSLLIALGSGSLAAAT